MFVFVPAAFAANKAPAPVQVSPEMLGKWVATEDCEKHPSWPSELTISKTLAGIFQVTRGKVISDLNTANEVVEKDGEGVTYRTIRLPESYNQGRQIVVGSIWKKEGDKKPGTGGLSIIMGVYKLQDVSTLIYEKYGYESEERPDDLMIAPYSKSFPKNYRCVFKKAS
ncbi:hypothetical protein K2X30_01240 [bacterium]|jgi:hypothetical protein|nr:hypothetical protein [bacterium]